MEKRRFKQGAWNLLCLQTGMCLPSARSRESVCKSHELLFTKKRVQKHFPSARAATVSRNLKVLKKEHLLLKEQRAQEQEEHAREKDELERQLQSYRERIDSLQGNTVQGAIVTATSSPIL